MSKEIEPTKELAEKIADALFDSVSGLKSDANLWNEYQQTNNLAKITAQVAEEHMAQALDSLYTSKWNEFKDAIATLEAQLAEYKAAEEAWHMMGLTRRQIYRMKQELADSIPKSRLRQVWVCNEYGRANWTKEQAEEHMVIANCCVLRYEIIEPEEEK